MPDNDLSLDAQAPALPFKTRYVLLMGAVVVETLAATGQSAAEYALANASTLVDPAKIQWAVKHVSTEPIEFAGEAE